MNMTDGPHFSVKPPEVSVACHPQSHVPGQHQLSQSAALCRCSSEAAGMQLYRGSSTKEGAGHRGRKRKTGGAAKLCRDKVTPL